MLDILNQAGLMVGPLLSTFLFIFATIILLLWYSYRKQRYWKDRGIPFVKAKSFFGSMSELSNKHFHEIEIERYKKHGRIYGHFEGSNPFLSVAEPEIIKKILVKDFHAFPGQRIFDPGDKLLEKMLSLLRGEDWKRVRTIITPTFTTGKIKKMISIFKDCGQTLVQNLKEAAVAGKPIEAKRIYGAFTMDVIASSAFSTKIDSHNDPNNLFVQNARLAFGQTFNWKFMILFIFPSLIKLLNVSFISKEAIKFFHGVTLQIIEDRKKTGQTRNDFLQLLLDTSKKTLKNNEDLDEKDDIAQNYGEEDNQMFKQNIYAKKSLSDDELIAQCLLFFLGGYETTSSTISFVSYQLSLNPDIQEKLIQEIDNALEESNGELSYEAIQSMKYLDNVISETLRLYPPISRLDRTAAEDYFLKDIGVTIPKGMIVTIPICAIHMDPTLYHDPEKFDPDRFTPEERAKRDQYSYLPFSHGPKNCVAMRFALVEIKICLAYVLSNFRIKKCPETKVPLEFHSGKGLLNPKDLRISFEIRTDAVNVTQS